jgi:hypothetical protein
VRLFGGIRPLLTMVDGTRCALNKLLNDVWKHKSGNQ